MAVRLKRPRRQQPQQRQQQQQSTGSKPTTNFKHRCSKIRNWLIRWISFALVAYCTASNYWFLFSSLHENTNTDSIREGAIAVWEWLPSQPNVSIAMATSHLFPMTTTRNTFNLKFPHITEDVTGAQWYPRYLQHYDYCNNTKHNFVANRKAVESRPGSVNQDIQKQVPSQKAARAFSLQPQAFERRHAQDCTSVQQLLQAIQDGQRIWLDPSVQKYPTLIDNDKDAGDKELMAKMRQKWKSPSYFVPAHCHIPFVDGQTLCQEFLPKFRHVLLLGDSLQRHVHQGLLGQLRPNFIRGWAHLASDPMMKKHCYCDGQYSEHRACRQHNPNVVFHNLTLLESSKFCGRYYTTNENPNNNTHINDNVKLPTLYMHELMAPKTQVKGYNELEHVKCNPDDSSSDDVLLLVNGGLWFKSQADPTFDKFLKHVLRNPNIEACAKQRKVIVIWASYQTNHPDLHLVNYPHQNPKNGHVFNQNMTALMQRHHLKNVAIVNWMNMTEGAQVSDGLHYLTDVNTFKVQQLLLLARYMQQEGMYFCDKQSDATCI